MTYDEAVIATAAERNDCLTAVAAERDAERKRCLAVAFEVLQHGPGFDASKDFADGYSLAAQEIAAAIQRSRKAEGKP